MAEQTVEQQLEELAEKQDGDLTEEQIATVLDGGSLDMGTGDNDEGKPILDQSDDKEDGSDSDDGKVDKTEAKVDDQTDKDDEQQDGKEEDEPVVLAKDGKHTIPYASLTEAREEAKFWKQQASQKPPDGDKAADPEDGDQAGDDQQEAEPFDFKQKRLDLLDAWENDDKDEIEKISTEIQEAEDQRIENRAAEIAQQIVSQKDVEADQKAVDANQAEILQRHPVLKDDSNEYFAFIGQRDLLLKEGKPLSEALITAENRVFGKEKASEGDTSTPKADPKSKVDVDGAIAKAAKDGAAPGSLSDIPGSNAHHDEAEALGQLSDTALLSKLEGMTQDEIEDTMNRLV